MEYSTSRQTPLLKNLYRIECGSGSMGEKGGIGRDGDKGQR
jgi:hypothetical protein